MAARNGITLGGRKDNIAGGHRNRNNRCTCKCICSSGAYGMRGAHLQQLAYACVANGVVYFADVLAEVVGAVRSNLRYCWQSWNVQGCICCVRCMLLLLPCKYFLECA